MKDVARVFSAIADPTRRETLQILKRGERSAGEIAARFPVSAPSISRHLAILKAADLVAERRQGNRIFYRLVPERVAHALGDLLSAVCPTPILRRLREGTNP